MANAVDDLREMVAIQDLKIDALISLVTKQHEEEGRKSSPLDLMEEDNNFTRINDSVVTDVDPTTLLQDIRELRASRDSINYNMRRSPFYQHNILKSKGHAAVRKSLKG